MLCYGMVKGWYAMVWYGMVTYGMVKGRYGMVWYGQGVVWEQENKVR